MARTSKKQIRIRTQALAIGLLTGAVASGCGKDDDQGCEDAACNGTTVAMTSAATDAESSSSAAASESSSGPADSSTSSPATDSGSESTGSSDGRCAPAQAPFGQTLPDLPQASISFDFDAHTCAVMGLMSMPPQIVIDVKESGLLNATAYGLEITHASSGLKFSDPPQGDSQVIDFSPGVNMTFEATTIPNDELVTIEFYVDPAGPALRDVSAVYD
jgi:hypothetical protein